MSVIRRRLRLNGKVLPLWTVGVLAFAALVVVLVPTAWAQLSNVGKTPKMGEDNVGVGDPPMKNFCVGNQCPGQTCDEVNDRCVGSVTLQPAMGEPLVGLKKKQRDRFDAGKLAFTLDFGVETGLGPAFNQDSCGSCHNAPVGGSGTITVLRFGVLDFDTLEFDPLAEFGGSLLQAQAISLECAEVIPVPPTNFASERLTNSTLGFGLVEAIPDAAIEANALAPPSALVSGRVHVVPVLEEPGTFKIGRFGWKSQLATVLSFSGDASLQEMGITNRIFPADNAPNNDPDKLAVCDTVADPETVPDASGLEFIDRVTDFQRFLAPPPQTPRSGMTGEALFVQVGCADCHLTTPFYTPDDDEDLENALEGQPVNAYTDFLLHDMGDAADFIEQGGAEVRELRTPPLWGLRVRDPMWHDGRAAGGSFTSRITKVVNQHNAANSEAKPSAMAYNALSSAQKAAVVAFLGSLGRQQFDMDGDGQVDATDTPLVEACVTGPSPGYYSPDDACAVADADADGDVDDDDLDLLNVVLGVIVEDDDEDEDEDEDGDATGEDDGPVPVPDPGPQAVEKAGGQAGGGAPSSFLLQEDDAAESNSPHGDEVQPQPSPRAGDRGGAREGADRESRTSRGR
jgi:hypothetical protein